VLRAQKSELVRQRLVLQSADVTLLKRLSANGVRVDVFTAAAEIEKRVTALKPPDDTRYRLRAMRSSWSPTRSRRARSS
jgi:hypothetical protein